MFDRTLLHAASSDQLAAPNDNTMRFSTHHVRAVRNAVDVVMPCDWTCSEYEVMQLAKWSAVALACTDSYSMPMSVDMES